MSKFNLPPELAGFGLAVVLAILRLLYERKEKRPARIIIEALICGGLALTTFYGVKAMGIDINWAVFAGGMIGYFGSTTLHMVALRYVDRYVGRSKPKSPP